MCIEKQGSKLYEVQKINRNYAKYLNNTLTNMIVKDTNSEDRPETK